MQAERGVVGMLVHWTNGPSGNLGTITEVGAGGRQIRIRLDSGEDFAFAWPSEAIERVDLKPGQPVRSEADGSVGLITGAVAAGGLVLYQVAYPGGAVRDVVEGSLRPAVISDPIVLLRQGSLDTARSVNLRLTATRLAIAHQFDVLSSLSNSRVEIKPHQVGVLHRVAMNYPHRYLLADEVGLGKTIEAGLIIKELKARGTASRVLILAPSGIVSQWQSEMRTKFSQAFSLYRRSTIDYLQDNHPGENVWTLNNDVIASTTYASWDERRRREIALAGWDMVIIDEAHHARRTWQGGGRYRETNLYKLAKMLADPEVGRPVALLLLTATPMQLHRYELYSLIELLDPALFANFADFDTHCDSLNGLNEIVDSVQRWTSLGEVDRATTADRISTLLDRPAETVAASLALVSCREDISNDVAKQHRLSEAMLRNRKAVVGGFMPRVAVIWNVEMSPQERDAYDAVTSYVRTGYAASQRTKNNSFAFLMTTFQRLNASSSFALRQSLLRRIEKLEAGFVAKKLSEAEIEEEDLEEKPTEDALSDWLGMSIGDSTAEELRQLARLVLLLDAIPLDSKAQVMLAHLVELADNDPATKVVLFTQSRDTQSYLARSIPPSWAAHVFHGQLSPSEKDAAIQAFRAGVGPQILVSTEAGGEGRNLQFAHTIINYDLPWNPMKIEQRIGRLDRLGQTHPVTVINLSIRGTIEERVLEVLTRRIRVFEETIGGLDPILGDVESNLRRVFLLADQESERMLRRFEGELEDRVHKARTAEERLGDLIMDTKSFRQDEIRDLLETRGSLDMDAMRSFGLGSLSELGVEIGKDPELKGAYVIHLRGQFANDFPAFVEEGPTRRVTFSPSVALDDEAVEFLAIGHPLMDALVARAQVRSYPGRASMRVIATSRWTPRSGWLLTFVLDFEGVVRAKEVFPVFVNDVGEADLGFAAWLVERAAGVRFEDILGHDLPDRGPQFEEAVRLAQEVAAERLLERQAQLSSLNSERLEQERAKLERFYEYREKAAAEKLAATRETFERISLSEDTDVQRIIPVWAKNLEDAKRLYETVGLDRERRLGGLNGREYVAAQRELLTASYIVVVEEREAEAPRQ